MPHSLTATWAPIQVVVILGGVILYLHARGVAQRHSVTSAPIIQLKHVDPLGMSDADDTKTERAAAGSKIRLLKTPVVRTLAFLRTRNLHGKR